MWVKFQDNHIYNVDFFIAFRLIKEEKMYRIQGFSSSGDHIYLSENESEDYMKNEFISLCSLLLQ